MRKTLAIAALLVGLALTAGCSDSGDTPAAAPASQTAAETSGDSPAPSVSVVDFRADVGPVTATLADKAKYPEGNAADLHFVITNHSGNASSYSVTLAVYDASGAEVGAILVDTNASNLPPVKAGGQLVIDGPYLADMEKLPAGFTVAVETVDRTPEV